MSKELKEPIEESFFAIQLRFFTLTGTVFPEYQYQQNCTI